MSKFVIEIEDSAGCLVGRYQQDGKTWCTSDAKEAIKLADKLNDKEFISRLEGSDFLKFTAIHETYCILAEHYRGEA